MDDTSSIPLLLDPAFFLPIPDSDMESGHIPDLSGPLKRIANALESVPKRIKVDCFSSLLEVQPEDSDISPPIIPWPGQEIKKFLGQDYGLSEAEKERLALAIDMGDFGARRNRKVKRLAENYRRQAWKAKQYMADIEQEHQRRMDEKDARIVALMAEVASLSSPFHRDKIQRATEAREAVETFAAERAADINALQDELRLERIGRQRDDYFAQMKYNKYKADREAEAYIFKVVLAARKPFSSSSFVGPFASRDSLVHSQTEERALDESPAWSLQQPDTGMTSTSPIQQAMDRKPDNNGEEHRSNGIDTMKQPQQRSTEHQDINSAHTASYPSPLQTRRKTIRKTKVTLRSIEDYVKLSPTAKVATFSYERLGAIASMSGIAGCRRLHRVMSYMLNERRMVLTLAEVQELYRRSEESKTLSSTRMRRPAIYEGRSGSGNEIGVSSAQNHSSAPAASGAMSKDSKATPSVSSEHSHPSLVSTRRASASTTREAMPRPQSTPNVPSTKNNNESPPLTNTVTNTTGDKAKLPHIAPTEPRSMRKDKGKAAQDPNYYKNLEESKRNWRAPLTRKDGNARQAPAATASEDIGFSIKGAAAAKAAPVVPNDPYAAERERNQEARQQHKLTHKNGHQPNGRAGKQNQRGARR